MNLNDLKNSKQWGLVDGKKGRLVRKENGKWEQILNENGEFLGISTKTNPRPDLWLTYDEAKEALSELQKDKHRPYSYSGIGLIVTNQLAVIDLDHCINEDGILNPLAKRVLEKFKDTYIEFSKSGKGLHFYMIYNGSYPPFAGTQKKTVDGQIEIYTGKKVAVMTNQSYNQIEELKDYTQELDELIQEYYPEKTETKSPKENKQSTSVFKQFKDSPEPVPQNFRHAYALDCANFIIAKYGDTDEAHTAFLAEMDKRKVTDKYSDKELEHVWESAQKHILGEYQYKPKVFKDLGQAEVFNDIYGDKFVYCSNISKLYYYDGVKWVIDESALTAKKCFEELAKLQHRESISDTTYTRHAEKYMDSKPIQNALNIFYTLKNIRMEEFDSDPYILNTPDGVIDLRTGDLKPNKPEYYCTKVCGCSRSDSGNDKFIEYLNQITSEDVNLSNYLQNLMGMAAIGTVPTPKMVIIYDPKGGCGKSTFLKLMGGVLGSYSGCVPVDIYTNKLKDARKESAIMGLKGLRFAYGAEFDEGVKLSIQAVKNVTSTDPITSKFMGCNYVTFLPSHTAFVSSNHLPQTSKGDNAIKDRMQILVFKNRFRDTPNDIKDYDKILFNECGGAILSWIVEGAKKFIANGCKMYVDEPENVKEATAEYWENNDWLKNFIRDYCIVEPQAEILKSKLIEAYNKATVKEFTHSKKEFHTEMLANNFKLTKRNGYDTYLGIRLDPYYDTVKSTDKSISVEAWLKEFDEEPKYINQNTNTVYGKYLQYCINNGFYGNTQMNNFELKKYLCEKFNLVTEEACDESGYKYLKYWPSDMVNKQKTELSDSIN